MAGGPLEAALLVGNALRRKGLTLAVAESCTGGLLASYLTDIPGSSAYLVLGVVSYSEDAKTGVLGVDPGLIEEYGVVSREVALALARGVRLLGGADLGLGITGVAGPDGGTAEKPVGLVWVALDQPGGSRAWRLFLKGPRHQVKARAAEAAMLHLVRYVAHLP